VAAAAAAPAEAELAAAAKADEPAGDAAPEGEPEGEAAEDKPDEDADPMEQVTKAIADLGEAVKGCHGRMDEMTTRLAAVEKAMEDLAPKADDSAKGDLDAAMTTRLAELESRLAKVEAQPAEVGRPAQVIEKSLGTAGTAGTDELDPEKMVAMLDQAEKLGVDKRTVNNLRFDLAAALAKRK